MTYSSSWILYITMTPWNEMQVSVKNGLPCT